MIKHLACIMDGNRRWAQNQGLFSWLGHKNGLSSVRRVIDFCLEKKIEYLSLYTFSIENLKRSQDEQHYLFGALAQEAFGDLAEFKRRNVRIRFIGKRSLFPDTIIPLCEIMEIETAACSALQVNFLLCYGGQQEITDAAKRIAIAVKNGDLKESEITPDVFETFLWTSEIPSPDLIIRTGGDNRLSNFLLFQCAYSELYFLDCLWPDISVEELESALTYYDKGRKNFGK